ncbi:MAG: universal stress protein [Desulfobacterales bacterium]|jgi:nucleotide-binding universal stress UspA family protein
MILPKVSIHKILYATDLSEAAKPAFAYAASMASRYDAGLVILHVIDEKPGLDEKIIGYVRAEQWEEIKKRNEDDARAALIGKISTRTLIGEALDRFAKDAQQEMEEVSFRTDGVLVVRGNAVEQILEQSVKSGCDLIVMGTHGEGTLADAMIGSTARRVVRRSRIPVLVVRLPE